MRECLSIAAVMDKSEIVIQKYIEVHFKMVFRLLSLWLVRTASANFKETEMGGFLRLPDFLILAAFSFEEKKQSF